MSEVPLVFVVFCFFSDHDSIGHAHVAFCHCVKTSLSLEINIHMEKYSPSPTRVASQLLQALNFIGGDRVAALLF